jgi:glutamyl-tRNA synthetase
MKFNQEKIVTRFAPSPTGFLHVGGLRTALYSYLFAKKHNGQFLLRIEDTDQERKVAGAVESLIKVLDFFKLHRDQQEPIVQSQRLPIYKKYAEQLVANGRAYYCFCAKERLEQLRTDQMAKSLPTMYDGFCQSLTADEIQQKLSENLPHVIRLKVPKSGVTEFTDVIRGSVQFDNKTIDDQVLMKSDGFPTYHLANVVDDHEMGITHVIRGEEWISSTPKHILLYLAFGWDAPLFAHLPLLLNPDKTKLSKRQGDVAVEDYLKKGYLPEALLNFVLLLGWNPGTEQEIFSLEQMTEAFDLERVNKAGSVFDVQKLDWLNGLYIRHTPIEKLTELCKPYLTAAEITADNTVIQKIIATQHERLKRLDEIVELTSFFFSQPEYDPALLIWKGMTAETVKTNLTELHKILVGVSDLDWNAKTLELLVKNHIESVGKNNGEYLWPLRVALSGLKASPGPFEIAEALGKDETIVRIEKGVSF